MADRDRFGLPPERDITPDLRASVLQHALDTDLAPTRARRRRWVGPLAVGAIAAAVVFGVVVLVNQEDTREPVPPTGRGGVAPTVTVGPHMSVDVDKGKLEPTQIESALDTCQAADPIGRAGYVLSQRRLDSPVGIFGDIAYANRSTGEQVFCTPWAVTSGQRDDHLASLSEPVLQIEGSRVQGVTAPLDGSEGTVYYDGAWFTCVNGIEGIEARIVVDGDAGVWHRTTRYSDFVYASTWRTLTPEQAAGDIRVEYRAVNVDLQVLPVPDLRSRTVSVPEVGPLTAVVDLPVEAP